MENIDEIKLYGKKARGRSELIQHLKGNRITRDEAIWAKCYDCMGYYDDGIYSCQNPTCSLFPYNPYKGMPENG